jgi:hypothetical protein
MIEDMFITYANNSLREDPENFYKIFGAVKQNIEVDLNGVDEAIDLICKLSKNNDFETILLLIKEIKKKDGPFPSDKNYAYQAVTGGREYFYLESQIHKDDPEYIKLCKENDFKCECREMNKMLLGEDLCEELFVLKCYECHQLKFIDSLSEIASGKEYSKIKDINDILDLSSIFSTKTMYRKIEKIDKQAPFREKLQVDDLFTLGYHDYIWGSHGNSFHAFNEYMNSIAYFSVTEFLLQNDRKKIKVCQKCNNCFVTIKADTRIRFCPRCSPKSKMSKKERREYQKKYRQRKKQERIANEKKARIENFMKNLDCTREEAEKLIDADLIR